MKIWQPMPKSTKNLLILGILLFQGPAWAVLEYSGQIRAAQENSAGLKKVICSSERFGMPGKACDLGAVRVIGDWAWVSWNSGDAAGSAMLHRLNGGWQFVQGARGGIGIEDAIAAGVPRVVAEFMVPTPALQITDTKELLPTSLFESYSAWELRIARNAIFARHGRRFQTKLLNDYFLTWPWYRPDPEYHVSRLTEVERANAETILEIEKRKGYMPPAESSDGSGPQGF